MHIKISRSKLAAALAPLALTAAIMAPTRAPSWCRRPATATAAPAFRATAR